MPKFSERARITFGKAHGQIERDCNETHGRHSAAGRLQSGLTAITAVEIFETRMSEALAQILDEAAKLIEHRGTAWTKAMREITDALETEINGTATLLENSFRIARLPGDSATKAINDRIEDVASSLREQVASFADGWTAPTPKKWVDRHPIFYAVLLAAVGGVLTKLLGF